jgi:hypothetical protein
MRKLTCTLLVLTLLAGLLLIIGGSNGAVQVSGTIAVDTTWTYANHPYTLTSNVYVSNEVTLTIEPGVIVDLLGYQLQVNGTLIARGTNSQSITFYSNTGATTQRIDFYTGSTKYVSENGSGCIIENAFFSTVPVYVSGGSPKISSSTFNPFANGLVNVNSGAALIVNNSMSGSSSQIALIQVSGGSATISNNTIKGSATPYGILTNGNTTISNNTISNCYYGIYAQSNTAILQNSILSNTYDGIYSISSSTTIVGNAIVGNLRYGIRGPATIQNNTIANNQIGIYGPTLAPSITYNNIYANTQSNIALTSSSNVDALLNWWGTSNQAAINLTLADSKYNSNIGRVNFVPFLTELNPSAPPMPGVIPPPSPTLTPTPTPTPTVKPTPTNAPLDPAPTAVEPTPTPLQPTPTPTPQPTPTVERKQSILMELASQFDISGLAKLAILGLTVLWAFVIITTIDKKLK